MQNPMDYTKYANTYYVEQRTNDDKIMTYDMITAETPMEVAKQFISQPIKCEKKQATLFVVSNAWRFGKKARNNYYC